MPADATDQAYVRLRLARVFALRPVLPHHGLMYRLTEVGPKRFSPPTLERALYELQATSVGLSVLQPRLYADPTLDAGTADSLAEGVLETLTVLSKFDYADLVGEMAKLVARVLKTKAALEWMGEAPCTDLAGGLKVPRPSTLVRVRPAKGVQFLCWITNELPWIHPDDPRFWHVMADGEAENAAVLIIARKVAPATFALCKALGAFALQFHQPLSPPNEHTRLAALVDDFGWPPLRTVASLRKAPVLDHLKAYAARARVSTFAEASPSGAGEAIRRARSLGFDSGASVAGSDLTGWADASPIVLPDTWYRGIADWTNRPSIDTTADGTGRRVGQTPAETVVTHGLVAAEVDRETWDRLKARLKQSKRGPALTTSIPVLRQP